MITPAVLLLRLEGKAVIMSTLAKDKFIRLMLKNLTGRIVRSDVSLPANMVCGVYEPLPMGLRAGTLL